jgi:OmcA/MtrC family decaheme c-type cytochrome
MLIKRGLLLAAAGLLTVSQAQDVRDIQPAASRGTRTVASRPAVMYPESAREYYMTQDELDYIRPGYNITINSITIPADNRPLVDLSFKDDKGQPLDRLGNVTPGTLSASMILAWWDPVTRHYTAYTTRVQTSPITGVSATQAAADSGGTFTDLELGHATYKFRTALPASYDKTKTHTLGIYATRNMAGIQDKNYYANVVLPFRPDNAPVTEVWDKTVTAACNNCHNPLALHGGSRREVGLCVLCHQPQTTDPDTGNTVDFKVMVHKIHRGENLPSVQAGTPYIIIGNAQSVNDFSTVVFPQDIRNCTKCHAAPATQAPNWYSFPSRAACASCHDDVNWVTGANHPAGPQADDTQCASCHRPEGDREFDASIKGAHTVPFKSTQLKGINGTILSVTNTGPGQKPTIKFQLKQNDGTPISPATFGASITALMGGPTTDYSFPFPEDLRERVDGASFDGTTATYTFTHAIPADAKGTWAFGMQATRSVALVGGPTVTETMFNPVYYAAVTDATPVPRRKAVDVANCNRCHDQLGLHGGGRRNTEFCVICHNANHDDSRRRPADKFPPESVNMKRMIHRIHSGENLTHDFTVYGFFAPPNPPNPVNFNEVRFPGDRRDCLKCHVPGANQVSETPPEGLLPTITLRDWYSPMQPTAAACLGCHDSKPAAAHAYVMTAPFGEACAACHGADAAFAVDKVHAR